MTGYERLQVDRRGPVGWIVLDRPEALNAYDERMRTELATAWTELDRDPDVRVIVQTGNGRAFSAGADAGELDDAPERFADLDQAVRFTSQQLRVRKPVIAAVNGICAGGALHWVADADIVIASMAATFTDPHVSVGHVSALEPIGLMRKMPVEAVMRMALVGRFERIDAHRAYELGMVSQVVDPPENLRDEAQALAERIARNSPEALRLTKLALWEALDLGLTDACRAGAKRLTSMWGHPDQDEGPRAFAERRDPRWLPLEDDPS